MRISQYFHTYKQRRQRGDTIVEVLIAIAVISLVLGGAYVTTNRSLRATRSAQERANALKLVESQLEQLKGVVATDPTSVFGVGVPSPFCIYNNLVTNPSTGNCDVDTAGNPTTAEPKFSVRITRSSNTFTLRNTWTDVGGLQNAETQMTYRVYQ